MNNYFIGASEIHGNGVMASRNLKENETVALGIGFRYNIIPYVTPEFGSFINHSYTPTGYLCYIYCDNDENREGWYVKTYKPLKKGEEVTVNYEHTPWYIEGPLPHYI